MMHMRQVCKASFSTRAASYFNESVVNDLKRLIGSANVTTSKSSLEAHGKDESHFESHPPDIVVYALNKSHVQNTAKFCHQHGLALVPFGTGTGLEGGVNAMNGGICLDMGRMNNILEVNSDDFDCRVEAGVNWRDLNQHLRDTGLWFPVDPGASASLGGMAATGASGTNAVRYGTMKQNVLNMDVVLADGRSIWTSGEKMKCRKSSAGYNLTELFVGSEGTLGIITELTLRLSVAPQVVASAVCYFPDVKSAADSAIQILQSDIRIARMELMDELSMKISRSYSHIQLPEKPALFLEFHGSDAVVVERDVQSVRDICKENNASDFDDAMDSESRQKLWKARHDLFYATRAYFAGKSGLVTDVCVPVSKLADMITGSRNLLDSAHVEGPIHGHVGDGNFHSFLAYDPADPQSVSRAMKVAKDLAALALSLGGSCTGEHGIGRGKVDLLLQQFGEDGIAVMQAIKTAVDPKHILNPGKIFPNTATNQ